MGIIAPSLTMLEPKPLDKAQIEDSIVPGCADIVAQPFSERVGSVEAGVEVRIEKLSSPERERRIESTLGCSAGLRREEFLERVNENSLRFTVSNFVCEWRIQNYFDESSIEKRDADLKRSGHAHSIGVLENVIDQEGLQIHFQDAVVFIVQKGLRIGRAQDIHR